MIGHLPNPLRGSAPVAEATRGQVRGQCCPPNSFSQWQEEERAVPSTPSASLPQVPELPHESKTSSATEPQNKIISSRWPQVKTSNRFKVQKKHSGEAIETKPIIDFEGRKAVAWPAPLELFTTGEHLLGMARAEPSLPGAVEQSRHLHWVPASLFLQDSALVPADLPALSPGHSASSWTPRSSHGL